MEKDVAKILEYIAQNPRARSPALNATSLAPGRVSEILAHLILVGFVKGVDATHNTSEYREWIELSITHLGREVLQDSKRSPYLKFLKSDWKWLVTTLIAIIALLVALLK